MGIPTPVLVYGRDVIHYVKGDATQPQGDGDKLLIHIVNDRGGWGGSASFVKALSRRWDAPEMYYRGWADEKKDELSGRPFELGQVQYVPIDDDLVVCNMLAQRGYGGAGKRPLDYDALEKCLVDINREADALGATVHGPRFGTGLAGGQWWRIQQILELTCPKREIFIYDPS